MPLFRLGEVYLNYAEAKAELGTITQNDIDISVNRLRDRVGMPHLNLGDANAHPDTYMKALYPNVIPGDQLGVPHPDELLLAAGELALNLHRTAGLVNKPEPEERRQLLESADKHYRSLFNGLHPQAAGCRRLLGRIDQGE